MPSVITQLEAARKELLDLGLRNPLLNYRPTRARGVSVVDERSADVFDVLVTNGRFMTFAARHDSGSTVGESGQPSESRYTDSVLQTNATSSELQKRLLKTQHVAQTYIEENGVNILFLALGMLSWFDKKSPKTKRQAPLILVPIVLARHDAKDRFHIEYSGTGISTNLSLEAKLRIDEALQLPFIPESDDFDVGAYFKAVETAVSSKPTWSVNANKIALGFFSFNKFFMYNDLDPERWEGVQDINAHPVLRPLLDDDSFFEELDLYQDRPIDELIDYRKSHQVIDADSSQTKAILDVNAGRNLVIQGPPGTGKSQTITNLIAEAVGNGKKVLFVSEKMAALDVVKRKLDALGLGDAALELHSHKTTKATLMAELNRTFQLGKPKETAVFDQFNTLTQTRNHLNAYATAMNEPIGQSGLTPYEVYGTYLTLKAELTVEDQELPNYPLPSIADWTEEQLNEKRALVHSVAELLPKLGQPNQHPFWGSQTTKVDADYIEKVQDAVRRVHGTLLFLRETAVDIVEQLGLQEPENLQDIELLSETVQQILDAPNLYGVDLHNEAWLREGPRLQEVLDAGSELSFLRSEYDEWLIPSAWETDVSALRQPLMVHGKRGFLRNLSGKYREARNTLLGLCQKELPEDPEDQVALVDAILSWQSKKPILTAMESLLKTVFGIRWMGIESSDWPELNKVGYWLIELNSDFEHAEQTDTSLQITKSLLQFLKDEFTKEAHEILTENYKAFLSAETSYRQSLVQLESLESLTLIPDFERQQTVLLSWTESTSRLAEMASFNQLAQHCRQAGVSGAIDALNDEYFSSLFGRQNFLKWFEWLIADKLRQRVQLEREPLNGFEGQAQDTAVSQFQTLDQQLLHYNRQRLANEHWEMLPKHQAHGLMGMLMHEASKKRNHLPIRTIIRETSPIIQRIKPIIMMSPLSIAMYLEPGDMSFDLVVFDEASQVRPVDAFGAILRGKQTVVVGDSRQLPPTTFFDRVLESDSDEYEDDELPVDDGVHGTITAHNESILDLFVSKGAPERWLRWHYRSRHESLIALSNQAFYDNQLLLYPSPDAGKKESGLHLRYLPHSVYDRGKTRINQIEAEAVAQAVMAHAKNSPRLTLGVAAFSTAQRDAIEAALEKIRRESEHDDPFFQAHPIEPFFVKNLENVQGDERDVIFISMGYGKTAEGKVNLNFGPLNIEGGERRLNVLITRSRRQCVLFTNLKSSDIDLARTESRGVKALKAYLKFAESGEMEEFAPHRYRRPAPFEELLVNLLKENGYALTQRVGLNGVVVDIAILDPNNSEKYLVGIECDGETYDGALSARDRDRIQPSVLEGLGWRVLRVWSTEWLADPEGAKARFLTAVSAPQTQSVNSAVLAKPLSRYAPEPLKPKEAQPYQRTTYQFDLSRRTGWTTTDRSSILRGRARFYWDPEKQTFGFGPPESAFQGKDGRQIYNQMPEGNEKVRISVELLYDFSNGEFYCHGGALVAWRSWRRYLFFNPQDNYFYSNRPNRHKDGTVIFQGNAVLMSEYKRPQMMPATSAHIPDDASGLPVVVESGLRNSVQTEYKIIQKILKDEGNLHIDELERSFVRVVGASQVSNLMKRIVNTAVLDAEKRGVIHRDGDFIFLKRRKAKTPIQLFSRADLPNVSRKLEYVTDQELEAAILDVIHDAFSIEAMEMPQPVFELLGFGHLGVASRKRVLGILIQMLENGRLAIRNDWVTLPVWSNEDLKANHLQPIKQYVFQTKNRKNKRKTPLDEMLQESDFELEPYEETVVVPFVRMGAWEKAPKRYSDKSLYFINENCLKYDPRNDRFTEFLPNSNHYFRGKKFLDFRDRFVWNNEDLLWLGHVRYDFVSGEFVHDGKLMVVVDNFIGSDKYYRLWRDDVTHELFGRVVNRLNTNTKNYHYMPRVNAKFSPGSNAIVEIPSRTAKMAISPIKIAPGIVQQVKKIESNLILKILKAESPIHLNKLEQRISWAYFGEEKSVSPKIKQAARRLAEEAVKNEHATFSGDFLVSRQHEIVPRSRKELDKRWQKLEFVAKEELNALILKIKSTYPTIDHKHFSFMVAYALFGQTRFGKTQKEMVDLAVQELENQNLL